MAAISIDGTPMTALPSDADQINYDNSNSRLSDTQVQDAIDTLANDSSTFVGTTTQWDNLTTAQKKAYKYRLLTDDYTDASIGNLSALHTTDKSSVVGAVNEVKDGLTNIETLQSISSDKLSSGSITIKRNCGVKFVVCSTMILINDLAAGGTVELCAAGTVENPPSVITTFPVAAASGGKDIAPVYLVIRPDGSINVANFTSTGTKLYGYCCGAYI